MVAVVLLRQARCVGWIGERGMSCSGVALTPSWEGSRAAVKCRAVGTNLVLPLNGLIGERLPDTLDYFSTRCEETRYVALPLFLGVGPSGHKSVLCTQGTMVRRMHTGWSNGFCAGTARGKAYWESTGSRIAEL